MAVPWLWGHPRSLRTVPCPCPCRGAGASPACPPGTAQTGLASGWDGAAAFPLKGSREAFGGWKPPEEEKGKDKNRWFWVSVGEQGRRGAAPAALQSFVCRAWGQAGGVSPCPQGSEQRPARPGAPGPNPREAEPERPGDVHHGPERGGCSGIALGWVWGGSRVGKSCCRRKAGPGTPSRGLAPSPAPTSRVGCAVGPSRAGTLSSGSWGSLGSQPLRVAVGMLGQAGVASGFAWGDLGSGSSGLLPNLIQMSSKFGTFLAF